MASADINPNLVPEFEGFEVGENFADAQPEQSKPPAKVLEFFDSLGGDVKYISPKGLPVYQARGFVPVYFKDLPPRVQESARASGIVPPEQAHGLIQKGDQVLYVCNKQATRFFSELDRARSLRALSQTSLAKPEAVMQEMEEAFRRAGAQKMPIHLEENETTGSSHAEHVTGGRGHRQAAEWAPELTEELKAQRSEIPEP